MKINWKFVSALLAVGIAYDEILILAKNKHIEKLTTSLNAFVGLGGIMSEALDRNGVEMDEFERIAFKTLTESMK